MERLAQLKKRCIVEGGIFGTIALVAAVLAYFSYSFTTSSAEEISRLRNQKVGIESNRDQLSRDLEAAEHAVIAYERIKKANPEENYTLNREALAQKLAQWQKAFFINSLKANIEVVKTEPMPNLGVALRKHKFMHSGVELEFEGLLDSHIWMLLETIRRSSGGYAQVQSLDLKRSCKLDRSILIALAQGRKLDCIKGSLSFEWIGLEEIKPAQPADGAAPAEGAMP